MIDDRQKIDGQIEKYRKQNDGWMEKEGDNVKIMTYKDEIT